MRRAGVASGETAKVSGGGGPLAFLPDRGEYGISVESVCRHDITMTSFAHHVKAF
jgi:hypothetical protein